MNMISTGAFLPEMDASNKQETAAEKFARVWEKKNSKAARAGGVSLMALSLAACGSSSTTTTTTTTDTTDTTDNVVTTDPEPLAFGADKIVGTSGNDTFTASLVNDGAGALAESLQAEDEIDGGAGTDTLEIVSAANVGAPVIKNVEIITVRSTNAAQDLDLSLSDDSVTTINVRDSAANVEITDIQNNVAVNISNTTDDVDIGWANDALDSATATLALGVDGFVGTLGLTVGGDDVITTATITASGDASTVTADLTTVTVINVSGAGALTAVAAGANDFDAITEVNAGDHTGGLTIDLDTNDLDVTVTTGSGDDSVTLSDNGDEGRTINLGAGDDTLALDDAEADLTIANASGSVPGDSINGGAGDDTLSVTGNTGADVFQQDVSDIFVGFENLDIATDDDDQLDLDNISSIANINVTVGLDEDTMTITNIAAQNITFSTGSTAAGAADDGDIILSLADATGDADVGNITVVGGFNGTSNVIGQLQFDDVETLNVTANHAAAITTAANQVLTISSLDADAAETINISGNATVTIAALQNAVADQVISAANAKAVDLTFANAVDVTITGSSGDDTFTMTSNMDGSDTVDGGDGDDTVEAAVDSTGGDATLALAAISNVETTSVAVTSDGAVGETATINAAKLTSGTLQIDATQGATFATGSDTIAVTNLQAGVSVTINQDVAALTNDYLLTLALETATGDADALTVNLTEADGGNQAINDVTMTAIEALTLNVTADTSNDTIDTVTLSDLSADDLETLTIVSEEDIAVTFTESDALKTVDATGAVRGVDIDISGSDDTGVTVLLGDAAVITAVIDINLVNTDLVADVIKVGANKVGAVTITDFTAGNSVTADKIDLSAYGVTGLSDLALTEAGGNTTIEITGDANFGSIVLDTVAVATLVTDNFIFA